MDIDIDIKMRYCIPGKSVRDEMKEGLIYATFDLTEDEARTKQAGFFPGKNFSDL